MCIGTRTSHVSRVVKVEIVEHGGSLRNRFHWQSTWSRMLQDSRGTRISSHIRSCVGRVVLVVNTGERALFLSLFSHSRRLHRMLRVEHILSGQRFGCSVGSSGIGPSASAVVIKDYITLRSF